MAETRTFEAELEVRQAGDGALPAIEGYAVVFDAWSEVMTDSRGRPFRERISPTALDRTLSGLPDVRALWNHNSDMPLGRTRNGTLRLTKDGMGLRIRLEPPDTSYGADAVASIRRGDVSGMSFAFSAVKEGGDTWARPGPDGVAQRTLLDVDLYEVSPVTFPAYPDTSVHARSVSVPEFQTESDGQAADEIQAEDQAQERGGPTPHDYRLQIGLRQRRLT